MDDQLARWPAVDDVGALPRLMYDVPTAARMLSLSRSTVFELLQHNKIASVKVGARRLLAHSDLEAFVLRHRTSESATGLQPQVAHREGSTSAPNAA